MTRFTIAERRDDSEPVRDPERLTEGGFGPLLRDANRELAGDIDQRAAFQRLTERLSPSRRFGRGPSYWLVPATLLVLAAFVAVPTLLYRVSPRPAPLVAAEDLRTYQPRAIAVPPAASEAAPSAAAAPAEHENGRPASSSKHPAREPSIRDSTKSGNESESPPRSEASAPEAQRTPVLAPAPSVEAPRAPKSEEVRAAPDCLSLARSGHTRDAEACFVKSAEGTGLAAEVALYEVARLRRDVLADAPGALQALAEYRARFPTGTLRREADMSQLELLLQLGRTGEALKQSEELLSSSSSGERAAELHLLRGHILRKTQSRFAEAAREYELAERAGARAGDVTYFHALCLEALGQSSEAAALLSEYLEQPQHAYASDARKRLERLKP